MWVVTVNDFIEFIKLNTVYSIQHIYQLKLELMNLLQANGYKIYIMTGEGHDFVRTFANKTYGIPAEHIIGSACVTQYECIPFVDSSKWVRVL